MRVRRITLLALDLNLDMDGIRSVTCLALCVVYSSDRHGQLARSCMMHPVFILRLLHAALAENLNPDDGRESVRKSVKELMDDE